MEEENEIVEEEQEEDELGEGLKMFAGDRTKNLTEKQKIELAKKDRSFTKRKRSKNSFNLEKCLNTYGACQNKPRGGSNFCCIECEKMYMGEREPKREPDFANKFFEREKAQRNQLPIIVNNQSLGP